MLRACTAQGWGLGLWGREDPAQPPTSALTPPCHTHAGAPADQPHLAGPVLQQDHQDRGPVHAHQADRPVAVRQPDHGH